MVYHIDTLTVVTVWLLGLDFIEAVQCTEVTCLSCDTEPLVLSCPKGHKVIGWVEAGFRHTSHSNMSYCGLLEDDCFAEEAYTLTNILSCLWHESHCRFALNAFITIPVRPNNCPESTTLKAKYLMATDFECVPNENIHALCLSTRSRPVLLMVAQNASVTQFLTSVDFPREYAQYPGGVETEERFCSVEIRAPRGNGIRIWSVFMDVVGPDEDSGSCKREHVRLSDPDNKLKDQVFCGQTNISLNWAVSGLVVHFVTANLDRQAARTKRGFALKYHTYVLPTATVPTQPSTQPATQPNTQPTKSMDPGSDKNPNPAPVSQDDNSVLPTPIVVVVIVMAGVFLVAVVTVLVILLYRRGRTRDMYTPSDSVSSLSHGHV